MQPTDPRIAVILPCYNEEAAIGTVVQDFRATLPQAEVYVYDNNSRDRTVEVARAAGAIVRREPLQGKGNVVRRMFADVDADIYVLCDGDVTYDVASAPAMIEKLLEEQLDMVVGCRVDHDAASYRKGHRLGNALFTGAVAQLFGNRFSDILSGYRVFSRRYVKSFPSLAHGFEIETELTVHALELRMPIAEVDTPYGARPEGSVSKLSTYRDGFKILHMILKLFKNERPLLFFSIIFLCLGLLSLGFGIPVIETYFKTGLVPRLPTALLSASIMLLGFLSLTCGLILDTVTHGRREIKRLAYLGVPAPAAGFPRTEAATSAHSLLNEANGLSPEVPLPIAAVATGHVER
ncbi:glycosyltransferase family 2 protein [Noviherbaspirillum soli]|uniref:glycosyltransferase family 2 protein n=1 Tax=Noviherbaspirillum soli TaxID=1064518 RepID=UPI001E5DD9A6|nr:glycosyltransferase family 2 protein [Noviherbaspirillum soli]